MTKVIQAELTIKSQPDLARFRVGLIPEDKIRQVVVRAVFDRVKLFRLSINKKIKENLGLELIGERYLGLDNGTEMLVNYTEAVEVRFLNRRIVAEPLIIENSFDVIFGSFLINDLGLTVDDKRRCLLVNENHRIKV